MLKKHFEAKSDNGSLPNAHATTTMIAIATATVPTTFTSDCDMKLPAEITWNKTV